MYSHIQLINFKLMKLFMELHYNENTNPNMFCPFSTIFWMKGVKLSVCPYKHTQSVQFHLLALQFLKNSEHALFVLMMKFLNLAWNARQRNKYVKTEMRRL
jgi:hypothetical protein